MRGDLFVTGSLARLLHYQQQLGWQQNRYIAIGKGTQCFAHPKRQNYAVNAIRDQPSSNHFNPRNRQTFFKGVSPHHA